MEIEERKNSSGYTLKIGRNIVRLRKLEKNLYEFEKFRLINKNKEIYSLLMERFYAFLKKNKIEVMTENTARDRNQNKFMKECGLKIKYSKKLFTRSLRNFKSSSRDNLEYRSVPEIGLQQFFVLFKACVEDHIKKFDQFKKYFNKVKKLIHNTYDIENWKAVSLNNVNIGIVMPHIFPEDTKLGTLLEIGLKASYRGKGYGRIIHARGLGLLKEMGAKRYLGSTEITNYAMLRVFELNGCRKLFIRHFFYAK
jgi:RimJ/RimL family protein N-acetyltransferase